MIVLRLWFFLSFFSLPALAHEGHDHAADNAPATALGSKPQRLPDGRVWLPKLSQRQLGVRTEVVKTGQYPLAQPLNGHVVSDPNRSAQVQSLLAGRLLPPAGGFPLAGQAVRAGQTLALIEPTLGTADRLTLSAQAADLESRLRLDEQELQRVEALGASASRKEAETLKTGIAGLKAQLQALARARPRAEAITSPIDGVVGRSRVALGQVVDVREPLFDIIGQNGWLIEAQAYDLNQVRSLRSAVLADRPERLQRIAASEVWVNGALSVWFKPVQAGMPLAIGQPVRLYAYGTQSAEGLRVPAASVVRNASNLDVVWVHESAEVFRPVLVSQQTADGNFRVITGPASGVRLVTQGAALLNQIR